MKKRQLLVSSTLAILMSASLLAGATYSLFTSESTHDITVSSGKVALTSTINPTLELKSMNVDQTNGSFANGGTAKINENNLELVNVTPGDEVTLTIDFDNASTVNIKYKISVRCKTGAKLFSALEITTNAGEGWTDLLISDPAKTFSKTVTVKLPVEVNDDYQGETTTIAINVEAVQGNATDYETSHPELDKAEDEVTLFKMNKVLAEAKPATMAAAVTALKPTYNLETLTPTFVGQRFAYDASTKQMITILNENLLTGPANVNTWLICDNETDFDKVTPLYSTYLTSTFVEVDGNKTISPKLTCDASALKEAYTINYENKGTAKTVDLYTNQGTVKVDAPLDTVNHHGDVDGVEIADVAMESYHEFGNVKGSLKLSKGHAKFEANSSVAKIEINTLNPDEINFTKDPSITFGESTEIVILKDKSIQVDQQVIDKINDKINTNLEKSPILKEFTIINTFDELYTAIGAKEFYNKSNQQIENKLSNSGLYILGADIDVTKTVFISGAHVEIDLNGHTMTKVKPRADVDLNTWAMSFMGAPIDNAFFIDFGDISDGNTSLKISNGFIVNYDKAKYGANPDKITKDQFIQYLKLETNITTDEELEKHWKSLFEKIPNPDEGENGSEPNAGPDIGPGPGPTESQLELLYYKAYDCMKNPSSIEYETNLLTENALRCTTLRNVFIDSVLTNTDPQIM